MSKRPSTADHDQSVTESGEDEPFLSRWARRKRVARSGDADTADSESSGEGQEVTDESMDGRGRAKHDCRDAGGRAMPGAIAEDARAEAAPASAEAPVAGEDSQAPELTDEDMPTLDGIDENTDMSGFFSPKITQAVKKAALRKFFHSSVFNVVDGLDDYDEDFRNFEALGDIVTSDMRGQMEHEAERAREAMVKDGQDGATPPPPDARADESRDGRGRAKQDARAEEVEEIAEKDREDEPVEIAEEDSTAEHTAALDAGVTREPGGRAGMAGGKLRLKRASDESRDGRGRAKHDCRDAGGRAMPGAIAEDARTDEDQ